MDHLEKISKEVDEYIASHEGNLILVRDEKFGFLSTNRELHNFALIDDDDFARILIEKLLEMKVDIVEDWEELKEKYPRKLQRPMFYPEHLPWPPEQHRK